MRCTTYTNPRASSSSECDALCRSSSSRAYIITQFFARTDISIEFANHHFAPSILRTHNVHKLCREHFSCCQQVSPTHSHSPSGRMLYARYRIRLIRDGRRSLHMDWLEHSKYNHFGNTQKVRKGFV